MVSGTFAFLVSLRLDDMRWCSKEVADECSLDHSPTDGGTTEVPPAIPWIVEAFAIFEMVSLVLGFFGHCTGDGCWGYSCCIECGSYTGARHPGRSGYWSLGLTAGPLAESEEEGTERGHAGNTIVVTGGNAVNIKSDACQEKASGVRRIDSSDPALRQSIT